MFKIHVVNGYCTSIFLDSHRQAPVHVVDQPCPQKKMRDNRIRGSCRQVFKNGAGLWSPNNGDLCEALHRNSKSFGVYTTCTDLPNWLWLKATVLNRMKCARRDETHHQLTKGLIPPSSKNKIIRIAGQTPRADLISGAFIFNNPRKPCHEACRLAPYAQVCKRPRSTDWLRPIPARGGSQHAADHRARPIPVPRASNSPPSPRVALPTCGPPRVALPTRGPPHAWPSPRGPPHAWPSPVRGPPRAALAAWPSPRGPPRAWPSQRATPAGTDVGPCCRCHLA